MHSFHYPKNTFADTMNLRQGNALHFRTQTTSLTGTLASIREQDDMADITGIPKSNSEPSLANNALSSEATRTQTNESSTSSADGSTAAQPVTPSPLPSPNLLSRNVSMTDMTEEWEVPPETLTVFDLLDNLALPTKLESWQNKIARQTEKVRRHQAKLKSSTTTAKDRVVEEWRRRVPPPDEQLDKYRKRMRQSVDRLGSKWNDAKGVTAREKLSFIAGVFNIFISGYLIGAHPEMFYYWFTAQLCYFMPIRYYTYRQRGYHYFLADMCYFVNLLLLLSIWVAPQSKRLFISTYCLAYGNNAVAIAMWRNSMVFHSLDKVTRCVWSSPKDPTINTNSLSLFIHIMPPVTLHCIVHLTPLSIQEARFPGIYAIRHSSPDSPIHYSLVGMILWSSVPYAFWQLSYHFFITIRRREKIAAGRPTSFTWLKKSYGKSWIGKIVLGLPEPLQESGFMLTQYLYALGSMLPCPIWFWYRWPSAAFLTCLFAWSIYNGATYYIDVFGTRFQKELEQMKKDVAKWQTSPDGLISPLMTPRAENGPNTPHQRSGSDGAVGKQLGYEKSEGSVDNIPLLDSNASDKSTGTDGAGGEGLKERV